MSSFTLTSESLKLQESPTGTRPLTTLYRLKSNKAGPCVFIPASVHGAEVQGNLVLQRLFDELKARRFCGELLLLPLANPRATDLKLGTMTYGRFNPVTGHNWNRNYVDFTAPERFNIEQFAKDHHRLPINDIRVRFKIALENAIDREINKRAVYGECENGYVNLRLQKIAAKADLILDLHTGPVACDYLYAPEYLEIASGKLSIPYTLIIPHEFAGALDEACFMPWVRLENALKALGISGVLEQTEAYTVELQGEERADSEQADKQVQRLLHYLYQSRVLLDDPQINSKNQECFYSPLKNFKTYFAPAGGLAEFLLRPGEQFDQGASLVHIHRPHDLLQPSPIAVQAINSGALINHSPSAVVGEGHELVQVLENLIKRS
jgi:uncharacterized protein